MLDIVLHECSIVVHSSKQMFNLGIRQYEFQIVLSQM